MITCSVRRSRVERASRSSLVTINTSPASICSSALRSCMRLPFAPLGDAFDQVTSLLPTKVVSYCVGIKNEFGLSLPDGPLWKLDPS